MPCLLQIEGVWKSYAAPVLRAVDLDLQEGEVHALIGANGAGKTTLSKIICGLIRADRGRLTLGGDLYAPRHKAGAEASGVHMVQQELNLIGTLSVAENLFLNRLPNRLGVVSTRTLRAAARETLQLVGLEAVDPDMPVSQLGVGQQQLIEIAAALSRHCRLLVLDEPTAALTDPQIDLLFRHIQRLRASGVGILYISHRMDELQRIADRATILRDGQVVCTAAMRDLTPAQIVRLLAGKEMEGESGPRVRTAGPVLLRVQGLCRGDRVRDVSLEVHSREIFGIAGLVGSGRTELLRAIFAADRAESGTVSIGPFGPRRRFRSPRAAVAAGLAMIPEDRRQHGLLLSQAVQPNVTLGSLKRFASALGQLNPRREEEAAQECCTAMQIQCQSLEQRVDQLSGGNQQKVVMARWFLRNGLVYLCDEPTRGIDVAAKAAVYRWLNDLADRGKAVLVVSSEFRELLALCDRIGVMSAGRLTAIFSRDDCSQEKILQAALSEYSG